MRFLVLGASGMAGHTISLYLKERGHEVVGFSRRPVTFLERQVNGDACNRDLVRGVVEKEPFDVVVNAIGVLNAFADADPEGARWLNGELPHYLAEVAEGVGARVFHMSTDCVFAGNTGPYTEGSAPDGESVYDRTKAAGELRDGRNLTFRNSIVGPDTDPSGIGLLNWFMAQEGPIKGWTRALWTGLTTLELARAMEAAAREDVCGLVNMVPEGCISKYDLLRLFNEHLRGGSVEVRPDDSVALDKTLVRTNFECTFRPAPYADQVAEMAAWMRAHRDLYPHYRIG
ncbi:NAD(P)-dependent oxidoreductase [Gordonibacter sp. An230]|uniref:SDR family oxidoreductase n=1 Tax=Gordonibacter sp. An230 TaxID=1965592 RepID=UPI000B39A05B|nr:sugar nucleotide-binding protein [Gordonibacter sp. An230]OUO91809.1 NAD(P)-dependent oxidoreductase [Gordonibacter sp. An230]